jgi:hypothetical protein
MDNMMKFGTKQSLFLVLVGCGFALNSAQGCNLGSKFGQPHSSALTLSAAVADEADRMPAHERTAVGLWRSEYVGTDSSVFIGFESFYTDGNELLIDNSAPATDNVCSGVWEQTGPFTYEINHPSWDFDASGNLIGIVVLRATITVEPGGNKFKGTESFVVYDPTMSTIVYQGSGTVTGTRIRANSHPL